MAHDAGFSTAHYASKSKFIIYEQSYNAVTGADHPNGRDKIDVFFAQENAAAAMQTQLLADMATNHFNYTFVHYADPDIAGHASGWGSTAYNNAVVTVDAYLGGLFNMIQNDPALAGRTAIVLSADHGGEGTDHSNAALAANYTIPFFVWGPGIAHGDLYSLNGGVRTDPLAARVDYNVAGQPVRNGDGGNLALSLLGLGPIPGSLINLAQNLRTAMIGDFNADGAINGTDLAALNSNFGMTQGATHAQGDADGDHDVDGADLLVWQQKFSSPMVATATPEPGATALAVFAWAALATLRRAPQRRPTLAA